jgi:hypothetical protein
MATRGPERNVSDEQLIQAAEKALSKVDGPVVSTSEIAEIVEMSGTRIRERVADVEEIETMKVGGGPQIYWPSE